MPKSAAPEEPVLYLVQTEPGDRDHVPAWYFDTHIIRATQKQIDALKKAIDPKHYGLLEISPVDEVVIDLDNDQGRGAIADGLRAYHEVRDTKKCKADVVHWPDDVEE